MTASEYPTVNGLKHELDTLIQQEFTGRLDIEARKEQWHLYFTLGRLAWAGGGVHWFRRWHRCLHQYCPQVHRLEIGFQGARNSDYVLLIQWLKQQYITGAEATSVIRNTIEEVLFDILQYAEKGEFKLSHNDQEAIDTPLTLLNPQHVLDSAQKAWQLWTREGLEDLSPNLAVTIRQPDQLQQHTSHQLHQTLIVTIDGERTLRELALLFKQEPSRLIQKLGFYLQQGWMELIEVPDQSPMQTAKVSTIREAGDREPQSSAVTTEQQTTQQPLKTEFSLLNGLRTHLQSLPLRKWTLPLLVLVGLGGGYMIWRSQSGTLYPVGGGILPHSPGQLTMVGTDFSGHSTFRSAVFQDALKQAGIILNYQVASDQQSAELLNQGKADLELTTLDQFLQHQTQGKIVGLINHSVGGDAVVLNTKRYPGLKSLLDLNQLIRQARSQQQQLSIALPQNTPSGSFGMDIVIL